jgi:hypothetical protein
MGWIIQRPDFASDCQDLPGLFMLFLSCYSLFQSVTSDVVVTTPYAFRLKIPHYNSRPYLSILSLLRNERPYLPEWIEYHLLVGDDFFWLIDNDSTDHPEVVLDRYIALGVVNLRRCSGNGIQIPFYNFMLPIIKPHTTWIAIIDIDEFLVPVETRSVQQILRELEWAAAVRVNWVIFGTNGQLKQTEGLVIERFRNHTNWEMLYNRFPKEIAHSERILRCRVHYHHYASSIVVNPTGKEYSGNWRALPPCHEKLRIHHYLTKSKEEFVRKKGRGDVKGDHSPLMIREAVKRVQQEIEDLPDVIANDTTIDWAIPLVKKKLGEDKSLQLGFKYSFLHEDTKRGDRCPR